MSAFVLETKGYTTLAREMLDYATLNGIRAAGRKNATLKFLFGDTWQEHYNDDKETIRKQIELRINNLISANTHAVEERYNEEQPSEHFEFVKLYGGFPFWTPIQLIKHLQCLRYQMSEGDVPNLPIYKLLEQYIADLCEAYITSLDAYDSADWGW